jgi:hypothetical protein
MTMLMHTRGPIERAPRSSPTRRHLPGAAAAKAHLAAIGRFLAVALTLLAGGTALAAIMALKIAVYLPRLMHH